MLVLDEIGLWTFVSHDFHNICDDIYDNLVEREFAALILPIKKTLERSNPRFMKNCEKLLRFQVDKKIMQELLKNEPYLEGHI